MRVRRGFISSIGTLATGTALGQLLNIAVSPLLSRIYSPAEFGSFGVFLSVMGVAGVAVSLRYETAIVAGRDQLEAARLLLAAVALGGIVALMFWPIVDFGVSRNVLGLTELPKPAGLWIALASVSTVVFTALRYWLVRADRYRDIAQMTVAQNFSRALAQLALGWLQFGGVGLVVGDIVGRVTALPRAWRQSLQGFQLACQAPVVKNVARACRDHWRYPLFFLPSSILTALTIQLTLPLIVQLWDAEAAGQFALVQRVLLLPGVLLGAAVADVFHSRFAEDRRKQPAAMLDLLLKTTAILFAAGAVPAAVLLFAGVPLFVFIFGDIWQAAGQMAVVMAPWMWAQLTVAPITRALLVLEGQVWRLFYDAALLAGTILLLRLAAGQGEDLLTAIRWLSALQVAAYVTLGFLTAALTWRASR